MEWLRLLAYCLFGIYMLNSLWLFINALGQLHLVWKYRKGEGKKRRIRPLHRPPFVSIQVPVYNEGPVIEGLLQALARIDYPRDRYEVQVLDDSTDETASIIDAALLRMKRLGISVSVVRRAERSGYKAGALQYGLPFCRGEYIAIFDADFRPQPSFLRELLPQFHSEEVGLVQARWGHLNGEENSLTRIQTFLLDTHFSVEQDGRSRAGYFINFCGTAGIWRRRCIEDAGGWDGNVLSEDLDLSYRAQLRGWKLVFTADTEVPAELPPAIGAFKTQQFRWTKGMAQNSRKNLRHLLDARLPLSKKLHGIFHLTGCFVFLALFINALLTVPLLFFRSYYPEFINLTQYTLFASLNLVMLTIFYYQGTRSARHPVAQRFFVHFPLFLVVYMGLSVQNAWAVLEGLLGRSAVFVRTPKYHAGGESAKRAGAGWNKTTVAEGLLFLYFLFGIGLSIYLADYFMVLFFVMIGWGLGYILYTTFVQRSVYQIA